jgi:tRNA1(Val) A37 N6-methylase TrmN6
MKKIKDDYSTEFEKLISSEERHTKGQYFTHEEIVDFILNNIPLEKEFKVLDPTCGAGAFLCKLDKKKITTENIYGSDIDSRAVLLCKENIGNKGNLIKGDFIKKELFKENYFDVIIGNPPFQGMSKKKDGFPSENKHFLKINKGVVNSSSLVFIRSYFLLKEKGYIGFVLPKNFVRVDSFKEIRKFILENMQIILIKDLDHHFKDVRCDQIILIAQKKKPDLNENVEIITYKKNHSFLTQESYSIKQSEFAKYPFFPIFYDKDVKSIANKLLLTKTTLSKEADIFRGESIGLFKNNITEDNSDKTLLRGNCIERFGIKKRLYFSKDIKIDSLKIKKMQREKIVIQNISSKEGGIFPFLSKDGELTMDTITNIILKNKTYSKFITCLLGSRLCNFFMIHVIYLNSNFSIHTDKSYIGKLPVIYPSESELKEINIIYKTLSNIKDKYSDEFKEEYKKLNKIIYSIYSLNSKEIEIIEKSLKEVMSKKNG